ncbi:MAG: glycosyltransferase family 4 protein [Pseudomonadota bacterium]
MGFKVDNTIDLTVLQIIPQLVSGGAERSTVDIAHTLVKEGHKALVISQGGHLVEELERVGAKHIAMPVALKMPWTIYKNISSIAEIIKNHKVNIVHCRSRAPAWSAYYAARRMGAKFITTYHGLYSEQSLFKKTYNGIMVKGDAIISVSDFITAELKKRYPDVTTKVHTVKRGINLSHFAPEHVTRQRIEQLIKSWGLVDDLRNVILLPGRITQLKGHMILIDAVKELLKKRKDFVCVCPGDVHAGKDAYADKVLAKIHKSQLDGYILLPGGCLDMPAAYAISNIVVAPSTKPESFGRIPIEAQLMGKPVVASSHGGFCETIQDGETGFLFEANNPNALAHGLDKALSLKETERVRMSSLGRKRVSELYSTERMCREVLSVYKAITRR